MTGVAEAVEVVMVAVGDHGRIKGSRLLNYPVNGVNWAFLNGRCVVLRAYREMGEG